jgi:hypothetical protein
VRACYAFPPRGTNPHIFLLVSAFAGRRLPSGATRILLTGSPLESNCKKLISLKKINLKNNCEKKKAPEKSDKKEVGQLSKREKGFDIRHILPPSEFLGHIP